MGCWGMGMTQSDQFMETYENVILSKRIFPIQKD